MNRRIWLVVGVFIVGLLLRVINISTIPSGFTPDEASFGYDAYSISRTGKDQWGTPFPLVLKSFGDYKAPLYAYLSVPSVSFLGLNPFSVRLPNALLGSLSILIVYLLVHELVRRSADHLTTSEHWPLAAAVLIAVSPWHIMLSRGAFEANLITFLLPLAILFFFKGLKRANYLILSAGVFGLTLFSYHSSKVVVPAVLTALVLVFRKDIFKLPKKYVYPSLITFGIFGLVAGITFAFGAGTRASDVSILSLGGNNVETRINIVRSGVDDAIARLVSNKVGSIAKTFFDKYTSYFSTKFLYLDGPAETTYGMIPGMGVGYWFEIILMVCAIVGLVKTKSKSIIGFVFVWLAIGPIPAALTSGAGFAGNRAAGMLPALQIVEAYGFVYLLSQLKVKSLYLNKAILALAGVSVVYSFISFGLRYYFASPFNASEGMLWGNIQAFEWVKSNTSSSDEILVSTRLSEPHIYMAFVNALDPILYQSDIARYDPTDYGLKWVDQIAQYSVANFTFATLTKGDEFEGFTYVIGKPDDFAGVVPYKTFTYPSGKDALLIVAGTTNHTYAQSVD